MLTRTLLTRIILIVLVFAIVFLALLAAGTRISTSLPVLNTTVKAGDVITDQEIVWLSWPASGIGPTTLTAKDQLVGKTVAVTILPNEPIKADELGTPTNSGPNAATNLDPHFPYANADDLLKQKLPVFPGLNQTSGGLIQPGDYVNLLYVPGGSNAPVFLLQKIHVIAARSSSGQPLSANQAGGAAGGGLLSTSTNGASSALIAVYILAVTPDQAILIARYDPHAVYYLYTAKTDPDIPGVPSGLAPVSTSSQSPSASQSPFASPLPSVAPSSSLRPTSSFSPAPTVTPKAP